MILRNCVVLSEVITQALSPLLFRVGLSLWGQERTALPAGSTSSLAPGEALHGVCRVLQFRWCCQARLCTPYFEGDLLQGSGGLWLSF